MSPSSPVVVLVVSGAGWEPRAVQLLNDASGVVVLKRCVDVDDLLAAAASRQADVAVVGLDATGLDAAAVDHLRAHDVRPLAVVPAAAPADAARLRAARIGLVAVLDEGELESLPAAVLAAVSAPSAAPPPPEGWADRGADGGADGGAPASPAGPGETPGRVIAVWGPAGAPGRTTVAIGLAAELARRRRRTVLVDADPVAASVAQHLGILDEVSGLLAAARLAGSGLLAERFASVQRGLDPWLTVVTGLPRPDRWVEVRRGTVEHLAEVAAEQGHVVLDTGASLEEDPGAELAGRPGRHDLTLGALEAADEVVVVAAADPVGLARLARGLADLRERTGPAGPPLRVVVNRMRPSLGWSEKEVASMVGSLGALRGLHFLVEDRAAVDRALVAGRTLAESGDSALARQVAGLADALTGAAPGASARRRTGRRARRGG